MAAKNQIIPYFFKSGAADGSAAMTDVLGGKGAHLSEMCNLGIAVPPGFILTTDLCKIYYDNGCKLPDNFREHINQSVDKISQITGKKFGSISNPLLLSVRSGAKQSMPGMMDTILNIGINDSVLPGMLALYPHQNRFVYDSYRRLIHMYGVVVHGIDDSCFEEVLSDLKIMNNLKDDASLSSKDISTLVTSYKMVFKRETGVDFPEDLLEQLCCAVKAVFDSWSNPRAIKYREMNNISHDGGTAVTIQTMVFGNLNDNSGSGVLFSRNPSVGSDEFFGEYLLNAQGEDIVAGIRTPLAISSGPSSLRELMPKVYEELILTAKFLEKHYREMQEIEFTISDEKLWILQTRKGKRSAQAAIKIAMDMYKDGLINEKEVALSIAPDDLSNLFHPTLDRSYCKEPILVGLAASPGSASGIAVFDSDEAERISSNGAKVILFRTETSPEDIHGMHASGAIVTSRGGMTSHAAVVARGMGKPCICGATELTINHKNKTAELRHRDKTVNIISGDLVTVSGSTGEIFLGDIPLIEPTLPPDFHAFMSVCDDLAPLEIRANADNISDCQLARSFGVAGIGLCRTEHMFFDGKKIAAMRKVIVSRSEIVRNDALSELLLIQKEDLRSIFLAMEGLPVTIRLLDPPLHEFISNDPIVIRNIARSVDMTEQEALRIAESLHEVNPMLGMRGVRLGIAVPEIYEMQINAILSTASELIIQGYKIHPEIMVPFVFCKEEIERFKIIASKIALEIAAKSGIAVPYKLGTMIELPRAALVADQLAEHADFFSFGTNDLTQTVCGISRDDAAKFIKVYLDQGIIASDPFSRLDEQGVGALMRIAVEKIRHVNPNISIGVCGEHGAEPENMNFLCSLGINYVSCSPYSVPKARLSLARVAATK